MTTKCKECILNKRVANNHLGTDFPTCPDLDPNQENALQMDKLPGLSPNEGYEDIIAAINLFSSHTRCKFVTDPMTVVVVHGLVALICKEVIPSDSTFKRLNNSFRLSSDIKSSYSTGNQATPYNHEICPNKCNSKRKI